ncbi:MAG: peptide ABC transporter substrate-binding protein [Epsilonproteobacteria bacterium]|nr:peptide ABC transporter substrate-binding protein [Campylobacterota bacterium]
MLKSLLFLLCALWLPASTLHLVTSSNPARLNPLLATDSSSSEIAGFLFNGLVKFDKDSATIIGDLATKFYFEDDQTLLFELNSHAKWHDGVALTADDVLFTYELLRSQKVVSPYASNFRFVKEVEVLDKYRVKVHYNKPYFKALEIWMMGILPRHILQNESNMMSSSFNTNPVGSGPYKLYQLEYSKNIILKANDDYFEGRPKIDEIVFHVIADPMTRFLMLKSGQIDIDGLDPMQYEKQLPKEFHEKFNIYETISFSYTYLGFNLRLEKFKDPKIREAISLAINREELVDILYFGHAKVCRGPFLPDTPSFDESLKAPIQDIERAKALLAELGFNEKNPFRFEIATSNSNNIRPYAAQILQHQLKKAGIEVTLRIMEWQAFLNMVVFPNKFDTVLLGWGLSPTPDPYLFWHSQSDKKGGFNLVGYHNPVIDAMIDESESIVDKERLAQIHKEMSRIIVKENPYLFLYTPTAITAANREIKNIEPTLGGIWHNYIDWEK